jgi:GrpB-like predicted nucleotidyltransferase (UPF0157 family)
MADDPTFQIAADAGLAREAASRLFVAMSQRLRSKLPVAADIRHIGATAVPGCLTKGDLDIVVRVAPEDFQQADACLADMLDRNEGSLRSATFAAFEDQSAVPHLGVQLVASGGPQDFFHLFVAALIASPALVQDYNALKARFDGRPMAEYRRAKDAFVARVLAAEQGEGEV